jgi:hypothetical protein
VAADCGFRIEKIRYYTPIAGGLFENILMRLAERHLARRAQKNADGASPASTPALSDEDALRAARTVGKQRIRQSPGLRAALTIATALMKLDVAFFGRIESGPFFALLERVEPRA